MVFKNKFYFQADTKQSNNQYQCQSQDYSKLRTPLKQNEV